MIKRIAYLFVFIFVMSSCKSTKTISNTVLISMSSKKIINNHYKSSFDKKTINATIKARYQDKKQSHTISIRLRMQKDSAIWMSARVLGIPIAKIFITPTQVKFYEKLGKTYFEGDFSLLSDFLGTEVDFDIIQNLLLGQAIVDLENQKFNTEISDISYKLEPRNQKDLFDLLFWINPLNFKINKQEVRQPNVQKKLTVKYVSYQTIMDEVFPKKISITAIDKVDRVFLDLEYRSVEFNKRVSFPFNVPSGYKKIQLHE